MQFFALETGRPVSALAGEKQRDYQCPECQRPVRLRSGPHRQPHFYHVKASSACRQHQKSAEHLQTQLHLYRCLPEGECSMERPFPAIDRIADLVWETKQIVFEVQCSPISLEEAEARCRDYQSVGMEIVWILHEKNFNGRKLSAAENHLRGKTCYFTDISGSGKGKIYDQFDLCAGWKRFFKGAQLLIDPTRPLPSLGQTGSQSSLPRALQQRCAGWRLSFAGDLLDRSRKGGGASTRGMLELEERFLGKKRDAAPLMTVLARAYRYLLKIVLQRVAHSDEHAAEEEKIGKNAQGQ